MVHTLRVDSLQSFLGKSGKRKTSRRERRHPSDSACRVSGLSIYLRQIVKNFNIFPYPPQDHRITHGVLSRLPLASLGAPAASDSKRHKVAKDHTDSKGDFCLRRREKGSKFFLLTGRRYSDRRFIKWARFCRDSQLA